MRPPRCRLAINITLTPLHTLQIKQVIIHGQVPRPSEIGQRDDQYMTYEHNVYVPSAYKLAKQTTKVVVPDSFKDVREVVKPQAKTKSEVCRMAPWLLLVLSHMGRGCLVHGRSTSTLAMGTVQAPHSHAPMWF